MVPLGICCLLGRGRLGCVGGRCRSRRRVEVLDEYLPRAGQRRRDDRHEPLWSADVAVGLGVGADEVDDGGGLEQTPFGIDVTDHGQPIRVARDEVVEHRVEDHRRPVLVGAQQPHLAIRRRQRALDERQNRA